MYDEFFQAVRDGDVETVSRMVQDDVTLVNARDTRSQSLSPLAAENSHSETVQFLLGEKNDLQEGGPKTPLMLASQYGHLNIVNLLLDKGAVIQSKDFRGPTALHLAALMGQTEIVRVLLQRGAKVGCLSPEALTPLHFAAMGGQAEVVGVLLSSKARVGIRGEEDNTPLHMAVMSDRVAMPDRISVVKQLLARKADCGVQNSRQETPQEISIRKGFIEIDELFRATGSKAKAEIFQLVRDDDYRNVKKLLERRCGIVDLEEDGDKPHHVAARCARASIMNLLLTGRAGLNAQNQQGNTALHLAVQHLHKVRSRNEDEESASQTLMVILRFEPSLMIQNIERQTAWDEAFGCDEDQVCFWIEEAGRLQKAHQENIAEIYYTIAETDEGPEVQNIEAANWNAERVPLSDDDVTNFGSYFLARRDWYGGLGRLDNNSPGRLVWNVSTRHISPEYPWGHPAGQQRLASTFLRAIAGGRQETVEHLLAENPALASPAGFLRRSPEENGRKRVPLTIAAEYGREEVCRLLLAAGADISQGDGIYQSPLFAASWGGHLSTVILLLAAGTGKEQINEVLASFSGPRFMVRVDTERTVYRPTNLEIITERLRAAAYAETG